MSTKSPDNVVASFAPNHRDFCASLFSECLWLCYHERSRRELLFLLRISVFRVHVEVILNHESVVADVPATIFGVRQPKLVAL